MSLKNINTSPTYSLKIPSTKKTVEYRPYNVGEQKSLLLAHMEGDAETILTAAKQMIENCTFKKVDFENSPAFDIEYILVKLRSKSAGEIVDVGIKCVSCEHMFPYQINLDKVEVTGGSDKNVKISEDLYIVMKYPTVRTSVQFDPEDIDSAFNQIAECIESIVHGEEVYDAKEQSKAELVEFISRLTESQVEKLKDFFVNMPKVEYVSQQECPSCKHENKIHITGITNFFI